MSRWNQTPQNRCMPFIEWPNQDQAAWQRALTPADFLAPGGAASAWADGGRTMVIDGYGHWLTWLQQTDQLDRSVSAESRITRDRVATYATSLATRLAPMTVQSRIIQLGRAMRALAPAQEWSWLYRAADRLRAEAIPVRVKRARMQEMTTLVDLGLSLMQRAEASDPHFASQRAALYRDGLMIALRTYRPLRMRSFAGITLGQHLTQRGGSWWLSFSAADIKTKQSVEIPFPARLVTALDIYLDRVRPILLIGKPKPGVLRVATPGLWIAKGGKMMGASAISVQIAKHTRTAFGQSISPHLIRDCVATSIAIHAPEDVALIKPILGHTTMATSERHYNQARILEAGRRHQAAIEQTRCTTAAGRGR